MAGYIRLPLEHAVNARDLGGYACDGGVTRFRAFIRSDALDRLDDKDASFLEAYGIRTVIDLRSPEEVTAVPDSDGVKAFADYFNIPIIDGKEADITTLLEQPHDTMIQNMYISKLKNKQPALAKVIKATAEAREGGVLFHCAVGKDRTGIIAALLLGAVGVSYSDILSNYEITHTYIRKHPRIAEELRTKKIPEAFIRSDKEYLEHGLKYLDESGGIQGYLKSIGIGDDIISKIRRRFVDTV